MKLKKNDIHIWHVNLETKNEALDKCQKLLSEDENDRAARLRSTELRHHYILARGHLRIILGKYLKKQPEEIAFTYSKHGKPSLQNESTPISFNVSHCQNLYLVAITLKHKIGIDIERTGRFENWMDMIKHSLSQQEQDELLNLPKGEQEQAFIRGWTRKEAYTKAQGAGLLYDFPNFSVTLDKSNPRIINDPQNTHNLPKWALINIQVKPPYLATLAIDSHVMQITEFHI